jgi:hypothetical protein
MDGSLSGASLSVVPAGFRLEDGLGDRRLIPVGWEIEFLAANAVSAGVAVKREVLGARYQVLECETLVPGT